MPSSVVVGVTLPDFGASEYSGASCATEMAAIAAAGYQWVAIVSTWYQATLMSTAIAASGSSPTNTALGNAIATAHAAGLKVMLKLHVDINDSSFRGQIGEISGVYSFTGPQQTAWEASYTTYVTTMAGIAQAHAVELLCIGTELNSMTTADPTYWRALIATVRGLFTGKLIVTRYSYNFTDLADATITFWDLLDYLAVDAYPLVETPTGSTVAVQVANWAPLLVELAAWSAAWSNKKVLFAEFGTVSVLGAASATPQYAGPENDADQNNVYTAAIQAIANQPWWGGFLSWVYGYLTPGGLQADPLGFTIAGKSAGATFSAFARGFPTTMAVTGSFDAPDGTAPTGSVVFTPKASGAHFANNGSSIVNTPQPVLLVAGALPAGFSVVRCPGGYSVVENIAGSAPYGPYVIPDQAGPVDLSAFH